MVYSDKVDKVRNKYKYQIIHAFGTHLFDHDKKDITPDIFGRKVIITRHDIKTPTTYGRIHLWD